MLDEQIATRPAAVSVEYAARLLGVSRGSAYNAIRRREIPSIRVGKRILIPKAQLDALLAGNKSPGRSLTPRPADAKGALLDALAGRGGTRERKRP